MIGDGARTVALRCGDAANDNGAVGSRVESGVLMIARFIGWLIAREAFERASAVNENAPSPYAGEDWETR